MIIDVHCHVWPDHIAPLVLSGRPAGLDPVGDGTVDGLRRVMDAAGIDYGCTLAIANEPRHVARTNEFAGGVDRSRFIPFGTVHTGLSIDENLRHLEDNGIGAVKFHPNFQGMSLGSPQTLELFAALADKDIVVLAHVGVGSDAAASERGATAHLKAIFAQAPSLRFIACHFGGYHDLAAVKELAVGSPAFLETSWPPSASSLGADAVRDLIRAHGADRFIFGSDWPMADPRAELAFLRSVGLTSEEEAAILGGNLAGLLGM